MARRVVIDPDKGVTELVRQLGEDSKRLAGDEVRLAKLEAADSLHRAGRGAVWLGIAFAVTVVALVAFTLFVATAVGRVANEHMWVGAFITAVLEIALGLWLLQRGLKELRTAPYSLPETRSTLTLAKD